ncbi:MAG: hypothetical protein MHPSP_000689 [Paramarteilia canceri]
MSLGPRETFSSETLGKSSASRSKETTSPPKLKSEGKNVDKFLQILDENCPFPSSNQRSNSGLNDEKHRDLRFEEEQVVSYDDLATLNESEKYLLPIDIEGEDYIEILIENLELVLENEIVPNYAQHFMKAFRFFLDYLELKVDKNGKRLHLRKYELLDIRKRKCDLVEVENWDSAE